MKFIESFFERCKKNPKTIFFPDSRDVRILEAARFLADNGLARPVLIGPTIGLRDYAAGKGFHTRGLGVRYPLHDNGFDRYAKAYYDKRKDRGITLSDAREQMHDPLWYSAMALRHGAADICIAGNISNTSDVLRGAIQCVGTAEGINTVSSFYLMLSGDGKRKLAFADCSVVPVPSAEQMADIAISTAHNYSQITGEEARVAMLSFSTNGSAEHPLTEKVIQAALLVKQKNPALKVEGEIQFDAAIVPEIAAKKSPRGDLQGTANVFIFPTLNAGNIGYKIAQHLCGYSAVGTFLQGLARPLHDLSHGCTVEEIIEVAIVASCM